MNLSILQNVRISDVKMDPFPHVVVNNALPENLYSSLEAEYPFEYRIDGYSGYANNTRYQISAVDGLRGRRLTGLWKEFVAFHTSSDFFSEFLNVFSEGIKRYYPERNLNTSTGVRFKDEKADMWLDCQPGMNSPVTQKTTVKGPHLDHQNELYGGLLYFRHPEDNSSGGELIVHKKLTKNPSFYGARLIKEQKVKEVAKVPYGRNNLVLFLNTIDSVHGVAPREVTPLTRRLVNFIGEVDADPLFSIPQSRSFLGVFSNILKR